MKRLILMTVAAFAWLGIQARQETPTTKQQAEKTDTLVFSTYWQGVYNLISNMPEVSEMFIPRIQTFTTQSEKYFGMALPAGSQRLFARNLQIFFTYAVMERYEQIYGKEVKRKLKKEERDRVLSRFYHRTDYREKETRTVYAMSARGIALAYPEKFFIEENSQYPDGEESAIKYLQEHLICQPGTEAPRYVKLSIDKEGNVDSIVSMGKQVSIFYNQFQETGEEAYLLSMPKWKPARLTNGTSITSEQWLKVPLLEVKSPQFKKDPKGVSADDYLSDNIPYEKALDGNYLRLSFVLTQEGKVTEPMDIRMFTSSKEYVSKHDYYKLVEKEVEMTDSLKGSVRHIALAMPEWEVPAHSKKTKKAVITLVKTDTFTAPQKEKSTTDSDKALTKAEDMPEFPGGMTELITYLRNNIKYPSICQENGIQGRVIVQFVVEKDGSAVEPLIIKSVDPYLDKEAVRLVKGMPKWQPGRIDGEAVRVKFTLPVQFRLQ